MIYRRLLVLAVLQLVTGGALACLSAASTKPEGWYQWAAGLFAGDVTAIAKDEAKPLDVITVAVAETFKGPDAARGTLTVRVSTRYWATCRIERPEIGSRVLVALNPNNDAMLMPLSAAYAEQLRAEKARQR